MDTVYTTTITREARRRGIRVRVIDRETPIFILAHGARRIRCFNALTDRVGAVSYLLSQDKCLAHRFLAKRGFPVPAQVKFTGWKAARAFFRKHRCLVVKPCREWGGRGISVAVTRWKELVAAVRRARAFGEDLVLEQCVGGADRRLICVNGRFVAAIERTPATVTGDGRITIRRLIVRQNAAARRIDPGNRIPLDAETRRNLRDSGWDYDDVPLKGQRVQVRRTSNFHTGGAVEDITLSVDRGLVKVAEKVAREVGVPVLGVDFLVDKAGRYRIIELSPDLAISPPEGERVAKRFLDSLFPETAVAKSRNRLAILAKRGDKERTLF